MSKDVKIRLIGYYNQPNQKMYPESEQVEKAKELAPLLEESLMSLLRNPDTEEDLKRAIISPTVFIFKSEDSNLIAYFTKDRIARVTHVMYFKSKITQVTLKYKAWFYPGESINLIYDSGTSEDSRISYPLRNRDVNKPIKQRNPNSINDDEISRIKTRLRLENDYFIGQFSPELTEGWYKISDIRNTDFTKIEDKERGIKDLTISFRSQNTFNRYAYYKFKWNLLNTDPLKFGIDFNGDVTPIYPKDIVACLHDSIIRYPASAAKKITRTLDTLNKQLTQSGKEVFIYELLQNANDYPIKQKKGNSKVSLPVDVEFHITEEYLTFQHTGDYFNPKNIAAICDINDGEKSDNVEAIGYKGIGFKTVFLDDDYVYLSTGKYSFRFDKTATDVINTPWQILPVWTDSYQVPATVKQIFSQHPNDVFRVKFALKPRDSRILTDRERHDNYIDLFSSVFETERVILFIPNIRKVSIFFSNTTEPTIIREKDSSCWCVSRSMTDTVPDVVRERINDVLTNQDADKSDGYDKIPEKYYNFNKTAVKFACKRDGRRLLPVEDAILYCYLPAKRADWGFKFLMNTDMVPNGPRDDIEDIELNHELTKIAGKQFYYWIKELIVSKEYDLDSIFDIIPDFKECKEKRPYKQFIEEFQQEFEALIKSEPFVPVVDEDGNESYATIDSIINDRTGITDFGVMADRDFISLTSTGCKYLPVKELRGSQSFLKFIYKYSPSAYDIDFEKIKKIVEEEDFQHWLKDQNNNNLFLEHLLKKEEISSFDNKRIFIEYEGDLFASKELYPSFGDDFKRLACFKKYIPHLNEVSQNYLSDKDGWYDYASSNFMTFDAQYVLSNYLLNENVSESTYKLLGEIENSSNFYKFLAENEIDVNKLPNNLPFITENDCVVKGFNSNVYFYNEQGITLVNQPWIPDDFVYILSHKYFDEQTVSPSLRKTFSDLGVNDFSDEVFIKEKLISDEQSCIIVNDKITQSLDLNISFVHYIFSNRDSLKEKDNQLRNYKLCCNDIEGNEVYTSDDNVRYFNLESYDGNTRFVDNCRHIWLENSMMYSLVTSYLESFDESEKKTAESFLRQSFGVRTFTDKSFFKDVVLAHKKQIFDIIRDKDKATAFVDYLHEHSDSIFDGSLSYNDLKDMPLILHDGTVQKDRLEDTTIYEYNEDAKYAIGQKWCPLDIFTLLDPIYSEKLGKDALQLLKIVHFNLSDFVLNKLIKDELFPDIMKVEDNNIHFLRWIKLHLKEINSFEELQNIHLLDSNQNAEHIGAELYIADIYQPNGIEALVKKYDESALFVSERYLEEDTEQCKNEWLKLFKKLNLKFDNKDILFNSIIPNLDSFEDDAVVAMLSKHMKDLTSVWNDVIDMLQKLRVKTREGKYHPLNNCVVVNIPDDADKAEPFNNIIISDEVDPEIIKANGDIILKIATSFEDNAVITDRVTWAKKKIESYIINVQENAEERSKIHINFIRELANLNKSYSFDKELISNILFLTKDGEYLPSSDITMGTAYKPVCDFEKNGIDYLNYLSESYITKDNKDLIDDLFREKTDIHRRFEKSDIELLETRQFAVYFWSKVFPRMSIVYKDWITDGLFDSINCIPTAESSKRPIDLYSPEIILYVQQTPNWQEKLPANEIVNKIQDEDDRMIFYNLPFKKELSFEDCLYYLLNAREKREEEKEHRSVIINWMLQSENIDETSVNTYREQPNALWRNGKGRLSHISELFVIHPESQQERAIFSGDEHVMITSMFPVALEDFIRICNLLKIRILTSNDFITTPINNIEETAKILQAINKKILILAAIENSDKYETLYDKYIETLKSYRFYVCDSIDLGFEQIHNNVERTYLDGTKLYYVGSWTNNRTYTKFCNRIKRILNLSVYDDICEDVLDDNVSVEECLEKYCPSLAYDSSFKRFINELQLELDIPEEEEINTIQQDYYTQALSKTQEEIVDSEEDVYKETEFSDKQQYESHYQSLNSSNSSIANEKKGTETPTPSHNSSSNSSENEQKTDPSIVSPSNKPYERPIINDMEETTLRDIKKNEHHRSDNQSHSHSDGYRSTNDYSAPRPRTYSEPKPFTHEDVERFKSRGITRCLLEAPANSEELERMNRLLGVDMTAEDVADTNYLSQLRMYDWLKKHNYEPEENEADFVRSNNTEQRLKGGKYIHKCSAAGGVLYISPSIWNKVADERCVVLVYLGAKSKDFMYINGINDLLTWVNEDDILIKLTGNDKVNVVNTLYRGVLDGVTGTAYTLIRVASLGEPDLLFYPKEEDLNQKENLDDY